MSGTESAIPYESQSDPQTSRTCGAACLSMVYRSLGREVSQAQIWSAIAKPNRFGSLASTTYLMVRNARSQGFSAVAVQARHPLQTLRLCRGAGVRAILNHRLKEDAATGHYSVLVDIDDKNVVLHDPFHGPSRHLSHAELLELWQPRFSNSEIVGNGLIGVAARPSAVSVCRLCHTPIPSSVECPKCKQPVSLEPSALLGCMTSACEARMWNYVCCPTCDYTWNFSLRPPQAAAFTSDSHSDARRQDLSSPLSAKSPETPSSEGDAWNLDRLFGELDKFCGYILSLPGATNHPEIKQQFEFLTASKEKLKLAQTEELAHRKSRQEQLANLVQAAKQRAETHHKKVQELNTESSPLDGNALGQALLKNLGLSQKD
jgi:predicted double-glycine peptidase